MEKIDSMEQIEVYNPGPSMHNILEQDNLYKLTDKEIKFLKEAKANFGVLKNPYNEKLIYELMGKDEEKDIFGISPIEKALKGKVKVDDFDIIEENLKIQLERLSILQEEITQEYNNDNISNNKYINKIMQLNTKIMRIIDRLDDDGSYIPF